MTSENTPETVAWECKDHAGIWFANTKKEAERRGCFCKEHFYINPLIRLSDHEQRMEEQREEVLELIEEEIENWKSNLQYDDRRFNEGCVVALQELKQKLKEGEDEARNSGKGGRQSPSSPTIPHPYEADTSTDESPPENKCKYSEECDYYEDKPVCNSDKKAGGYCGKRRQMR